MYYSYFAVIALSIQTAHSFTILKPACSSIAARTGTDTLRTRTPIFAADNDDDAWDFDENYEEEKKPSTNNQRGTSPLGINIGGQLEPLSPSQAQQLKEEATETINAAFDGRLAEIENLKDQVKQDFEKSKEAMRFASDLRAQEQTEKLMSKIDKLSGEFLAQNEELRTGTKLAAIADRNMANSQGLEVGSWGKVAGMNVLTSAAGGMSAGLLGSVGAANIEGGAPESSIEVDTQVKGEGESRIMIICDDKQVSVVEYWSFLHHMQCAWLLV